MSTIEDLADRFARLPGATLGRGPMHPRRPDPSISERVSGFLARYPVLQADEGYAEFMLKYAGADRSTDDESMLFASIVGFAEGVADIEKDFEFPIVDDDGFLFFADWGFHVMKDELEGYGHSFLFETTGERRLGIYRYSWSPATGNNVETAWYADTFTEWFEVFADGGDEWRGILPTRP